MNVVRICEILIPVFLSVFVYSLYFLFHPPESTTCCLWTGVTVSVCTLVSGSLLGLTLDIYRLKPYGRLSLIMLVAKYITVISARIIGFTVSFRLYLASRNITQSQAKILSQILKRRESTEYGKQHNFSSIKGVEAFRLSHPLTTYPYYEDYLERTINGEKNVIGAPDEEVIYVALTSGTTGKNKRYPFFRSALFTYLNAMGASMWYSGLKFHDFLQLRSSLALRVPKNLNKTEQGVSIGPASAMGQFNILGKSSVTPLEETASIYDESTMMYLHAVFGLRERELGRLDLVFPSLARSFFHCIESQWQQICDDIEAGTVSLTNIDTAIRDKLVRLLEPDPVRAAELRNEFNKGINNIAPRVWPHLSLVFMLTSGPLEAQSKALQDRYLGYLPMLSTIHGSTENVYGVNMDPGNVHTNYYTLFAISAFYEFIPIPSVDEEQPETKLIHQLEIGQEYEIVITSYSGLYRFRCGDVIKIVSYYNQTPQYQFCYRLGQMLNVYGERTTEAHVQTAIEQTIDELSTARLVDYTTVESSYVDEVPALQDEKKQRYYILFIEVDSNYLLTNDDKIKFDENLCEQNEWYGNARTEGKIDIMTVIQVRNTTFTNLKQRILLGNPDTSAIQFKMPRVQRKQHLLSYLGSCEVEPEGCGQVL